MKRFFVSLTCCRGDRISTREKLEEEGPFVGGQQIIPSLLSKQKQSNDYGLNRCLVKEILTCISSFFYKMVLKILSLVVLMKISAVDCFKNTIRERKCACLSYQLSLNDIFFSGYVIQARPQSLIFGIMVFQGNIKYILSDLLNK